MKNLIVYYSFTRNNAKLAEYLHKVLRCDVAQVETVKKRTGVSIFLDLVFNRKPELRPVSIDLRNYEHIIFIAPIWAGKIAMPLKSFLVDERKNVKNYSFATVCGGGAESQKEKVKQELLSITGAAPVSIMELWVSELLAADRKTIKDVSGFRIETEDLAHYETRINHFVNEVREMKRGEERADVPDENQVLQ